ncbi:cyclic nucleotide-binding domain-containing protein [Myxococcota bacterium]|jgi:CRP-like cAMP-binding protein|nr:cyclic nucleotide-binding domain-containing protein [Myxococcota bacterium]
MSDHEGLTEHNFLIDAPRERHHVGSPLFEEGEHGEELIVVVKGRVLLSRRTKAGESVAVATIQAGGVLGEIALLQPGPRSASAIVTEDAEIVRVHRRMLLERLIGRDPLARAFLRACAQLLVLRLRRARDLAGALGAYEREEGDAAVNAWLDRYDAVADSLVLDPLKPWLPR